MRTIGSYMPIWLTTMLRAADMKKQLPITEAFELQPSPKYVDAAECIAHISEITGDYSGAMEVWEEYIRVLDTEWQVTEGESVDMPRREILRLKDLMEK